jgi:L-amino acid N-acyltransferase YncA
MKAKRRRALAEVGFASAGRRGTASYYRLDDACVAGLPTAAGLVAGCRPPGPAGQARVPAGVTIRPMTGADAAPVLVIYQAGLDSGEASFEIQAPTWEAFDAARLPSHRHVAVDDTSGEVLGWAAVSAVSDRCVYQGVVEHSVYVAAAARGRGIGAALLRALISSTEAAGIWTIQSGIFPENAASLRLHERAGFRVVGIRARLGRHHGRWRDVVLLERRSARAGRD